MKEREGQNDTIEVTTADGSVVVIRQAAKAEILAAVADRRGRAAGTADDRRGRRRDAE